MNTKYQQKKGQTMMEYIILVALLAVASIPVVKVLGDVFRDRVMNAADKMVDNKGHYSDQGGKLVRDGKQDVRRSMSNFYK